MLPHVPVIHVLSQPGQRPLCSGGAERGEKLRKTAVNGGKRQFMAVNGSKHRVHTHIHPRIHPPYTRVHPVMPHVTGRHRTQRTHGSTETDAPATK